MPNLIFFGTPDFAVPCLEALREYNIVGVVCQPDKPAERGQHVKAPPVKELALKLGLPVYQPPKITPDFIEWFKQQNIDLAIVVAYGKILPQALLDASRLGFVNVHASLLPRWRGAAPIQRAIQAGDTETGVCIMNLVAEMDAGEIYETAKTPIKPDETSGELFERLSVLGAQTLLKALPGILNQTLPKIAQPVTGVTHAPKVKKEEALIDWSKSAEELVNHCRAMQPWPGNYCFYKGKKLRLFGARQESWIATSPAAPRNDAGQIIQAGDKLIVQTGLGAIAFTEGQLEGKRRMPMASLLNGFSMHPGDNLC